MFFFISSHHCFNVQNQLKPKASNIKYFLLIKNLTLPISRLQSSTSAPLVSPIPSQMIYEARLNICLTPLARFPITFLKETSRTSLANSRPKIPLSWELSVNMQKSFDRTQRN